MLGCSQGEPLSAGKCGSNKGRNKTEDRVTPYLKPSVGRGVATLSCKDGPSVCIPTKIHTHPEPGAVRGEVLLWATQHLVLLRRPNLLLVLLRTTTRLLLFCKPSLLLVLLRVTMHPTLSLIHI